MPHPLLAFTLILGAAISPEGFENICPYGGQHQGAIAQTLGVAPESVPGIAAEFCTNVGKQAYNAIGPDHMRNTFLGPIVGVTWKNAGDVISPWGQEERTAPVSGFLYIIGPGGIADYNFLRWWTDIEGR